MTHNQPSGGIRDFVAAKNCGDLLNQLAKKPEQLEFLECNVGQGQVVFEARYRVPGKQAALVEEFLHKEYGMNKLTFACCVWEPKHGRTGTFKKGVPLEDKGSLRYIHYSILMYSDETLIKERNEWHKIPYFYVIAEVLDI